MNLRAVSVKKSFKEFIIEPVSTTSSLPRIFIEPRPLFKIKSRNKERKNYTHKKLKKTIIILFICDLMEFSDKQCKQN